MLCHERGDLRTTEQRGHTLTYEMHSLSSVLLLVCVVAASALRVTASVRPLSAVVYRPTTPLRAALSMQEEEPNPKVIIDEATEKLKKSVASVQESLSTIRVGKATPNILDRVVVDYYGAETPLNQLAMVTAPTATQLLVDP